MKTFRRSGRIASASAVGSGIVSGSAQSFMNVSVPTFDVSRMTVFLKSISRPSPSSRIPLSKTWKKSSMTSGWAFSTSSSRTTL